MAKTPSFQYRGPRIDHWIDHRTTLVAHLVKNLLAIPETPVQFPSQEDLLEKGQVTHSSILGIPQTVQSMGSQRVRHD